MSNLIVPQTARPNRHMRRVASKFPNLQRGAAHPPVRPGPVEMGIAVALSPNGPALIVTVGQQQVPFVLTADQAAQTGMALISAAANFNLLQAQAAAAEGEQADTEPVPTTPELEQLLAESQAATADPAEDDKEFDDGCYQQNISEPVQPAPNSFDVNGKPCYEPPAD